MRHHSIRDVLESKLSKVEKVHTNKNGAEMMIKLLSKEKIEFRKQVAGLTIIPN